MYVGCCVRLDCPCSHAGCGSLAPVRGVLFVGLVSGQSAVRSDCGEREFLTAATIMGSCRRTLLPWRISRVAESRGGCRNVSLLAVSQIVYPLRLKRPPGISPRGIPMYCAFHVIDNSAQANCKLLSPILCTVFFQLYACPCIMHVISVGVGCRRSSVQSPQFPCCRRFYGFSPKLSPCMALCTSFAPIPCTFALPALSLRPAVGLRCSAWLSGNTIPQSCAANHFAVAQNAGFVCTAMANPTRIAIARPAYGRQPCATCPCTFRLRSLRTCLSLHLRLDLQIAFPPAPPSASSRIPPSSPQSLCAV